jgi:hypothetical protein
MLSTMAADFLSAILMTVLTAAPAAETSQTVVPDRISVIGTDPYFAKAAADLRAREAQRAEYEERDWQRRQQALMYLQSVPNYASQSYDSYNPYPTSWSYAVPVYGRSFVSRVVNTPHVSHHASRHNGGTRGGSRSR